MEDNGCAPSVKRINSFLAMLYYQHFIPNCSSIAKPLFALTSGQKMSGKIKVKSNMCSHWKLHPSDWSDYCDRALCNFIDSLLNCVVLSHPQLVKIKLVPQLLRARH